MTTLFSQSDNKVRCLLCPHNCLIDRGRSGICGVRINTGREIELNTYGIISGYALDPVEKKPLYHFFPGYNVLSVGSYGCNMRCDFCQNYNISQFIPSKPVSHLTPDKLVHSALSSPRNIGLAFTYNEPIIWFEFMRDTAKAAKKAGLYTIMVSNGYVNPDPLSEIITFIDAFNIDLKAFNPDFYRKITGAALDPVKSTIKQIVTAGRHLEITTLIIPELNDRDDEMLAEADWIATALGKNTPLHLSRYFPVHKRKTPATDVRTLERLADIAAGKLNNVYIGNTGSIRFQDTFCPYCGNTVLTRSGYNTILQNLDENGNCKKCGKNVYGYLNPFRN